MCSQRALNDWILNMTLRGKSGAGVEQSSSFIVIYSLSQWLKRLACSICLIGCRLRQPSWNAHSHDEGCYYNTHNVWILSFLSVTFCQNASTSPFETCHTIRSFTNFVLRISSSRAPIMMGTHGLSVNVVPTALLFLQQKKTPFARRPIIWNCRMSTTALRHFCHNNTAKLMMRLHP